jgi:hypothetical protein
VTTGQRIGDGPIKAAHVSAMECNTASTPRASITKHAKMLGADCDQRHPPRFAEIGNYILQQTKRAILEPVALTLSVEDFERLDPLQGTRFLWTRVEPAGIGSKCGVSCDAKWHCRAVANLSEDPVWSKPVNVPIPNLILIAKNQCAKRLHA